MPSLLTGAGPLADLIASLTKAEREGTLRERIRFLCRSSLLVVDEILSWKMKMLSPLHAWEEVLP